MSDTRRQPTGVEPGEFPFPIGYGAEESRYLTWIRNHSNYMASRGLFDYVQLVAVLLRGAILNFLITVPWLLLVSLLVAADNLLFSGTFQITRILLLLGGVLVVAWPVLMVLLSILGYKRTRATGSETSMAARGASQSVFGAVVITIVAFAALESLSALLDRYHHFISAQSLSLPATAGIIGTAIGAYSIADRVLASLGGRSRQVAMFLVGALGIAVPALIVLHLAHFAVYSQSEFNYGLISGTAAVVFSLIFMIWIGAGFATRAFSRRDAAGAFALFVVVMSVMAGVAYWSVRYTEIQEKADALARYQATNAIFAKAEYGSMLEGLDVFGGLAGAFRRNAASPAYFDGTLLPLAREEERFSNEFGTKPSPALEELAIMLAGAPLDTVEFTDSTLARTVCDRREPRMPSREFCALLSAHLDSARDARLVGVSTAIGALNTLAQRSKLPLDSLESRIRAGLGEFRESLEHPFGMSPYVELGTAATAMDDSLVPDSVSMGRIGAEAFAMAAKLTMCQHATNCNTDSMFARATRLRAEPADTVNRVVAGMLEDVARAHLGMEALADEFASAALYNPVRYPTLFAASRWARINAFMPRMQLFLLLGLLVFAFTWIAVDVNQTSVHGLWRDRLAGAFLIGADRKGDVDVEEDIDLADLSRHEAGSTAPYHLINVALNLHASDDIDLRDRRSDFFIFSKRFSGGRHTGYCRSEVMERVFPHMGLGAAMAVSAAAASPNMGRATNPGLVAVMTLLNVRLGVWVPHPGRLQEKLAPTKPKPPQPAGHDDSNLGFGFADVFREELREVQERWEQLPFDDKRGLAAGTDRPTARHGLVGLAFSGGGIRSATLNLGIVQLLHARGVFDHVDYMSTVSGGGFTGSCISSIMRSKVPTETGVAGQVSVREGSDGSVEVEVKAESGAAEGNRVFRYRKGTALAVQDGQRVFAGQRLVRTGHDSKDVAGSWGEVFSWRVPPRALLRELLSMLHEDWDWVNVSDGGHIENLATIELLRRRCKFIIIGDGEADPTHRFNGLATVIRTARLDLGIEININVDPLRLDENGNTNGHWAAGTIEYPPVAPGEPVEHGWILYFKSSVTGKEDEVIREYRRGSPTFPHESTADQAFTEGQFEAYRSLGAWIANSALRHLKTSDPMGRATYSDLESWMKGLTSVQRAEAQQTT